MVLNLYPYNPGHMLVCPYRHIPDYTELTAAELLEFSEFTQSAMTAMRSVAAPQGFNIGMNQGAIGGAGIAGHLHQHVVPRWGGDTNFITVVGGTKTMPALLEETRDLVAAAWPRWAWATCTRLEVVHEVGNTRVGSPTRCAFSNLAGRAVAVRPPAP